MNYKRFFNFQSYTEKNVKKSYRGFIFVLSGMKNVPTLVVRKFSNTFHAKNKPFNNLNQQLLTRNNYFMNEST